MNSLMSDVTLIDEDAMSLCSSALFTRIIENPELFTDDNSVTLLTQTLSLFLSSEYFSNGRSTQDIDAALSALSYGRLLNISALEPNAKITSENIRLAVGKISGAEFAYEVPKDALESAFDVKREVVRVTLDNFERYDDLTGDEILIDWQRQVTGVSLSQLTNNPSGDVTDSTAVRLEMNFFGKPPTKYNEEVVLRNDRPVPYFNNPAAPGIVYCEESSKPYEVTVECANDFSINLTCSGLRGLHNYTCPGSQKYATCTS